MQVAYPTAVDAKVGGYRWIVAVLIFVIYTIAAADRANIGFALPFIRKEFEMSNAEAGALLSLFLWGYAVIQIPVGFAVSRFGVRRTFPISMILTSILTGLVGTASSALAMKIYRFGLGLSEAPLPVGITTTIYNWFPAKEKGTVSGIFLSAVKFGPVIVPPICALIVTTWGWREIFYFFAIPGLILSIVWYLMVPDRPSESRFCSEAEQAYIADKTQADAPTSAKRPGMRPGRSFGLLDRLIRARSVDLLPAPRDVFGSWNVWGCAIGYSFQLGISNVLLAWIPTYLLTVKKFSVMGTGFVAAAPWIGAVAGNLIGGWFSDRVLAGRRKPGMLFSALATSGTMYLLINAPADPVVYAFLLFATGLLLSFGFSAYMAYPMGLADKPAFPIAIAVVNMVGQAGGAAAPLMVGLLLDNYGWDYVFLFMGLGSLMSFVAVATIVEPIARTRSAG